MGAFLQGRGLVSFLLGFVGVSPQLADGFLQFVADLVQLLPFLVDFFKLLGACACFFLFPVLGAELAAGSVRFLIKVLGGFEKLRCAVGRLPGSCGMVNRALQSVAADSFELLIAAALGLEARLLLCRLLCRLLCLLLLLIYYCFLEVTGFFEGARPRDDGFFPCQWHGERVE